MIPADSSGYESYVRALGALHAIPEAHAGALRATAATYEQAIGFTNASVENAGQRYQRGAEAIARHLDNAVGFLAKLEDAPRIPPRIKPSIVPQSAVAADVDGALLELGALTIALGEGVDRALQRAPRVAPDPVTHVAGPPPPMPPEPLRSRRLPLGATILLVAAIVVATLILVTVSQ